MRDSPRGMVGIESCGGGGGASSGGCVVVDEDLARPVVATGPGLRKPRRRVHGKRQRGERVRLLAQVLLRFEREVRVLGAELGDGLIAITDAVLDVVFDAPEPHLHAALDLVHHAGHVSAALAQHGAADPHPGDGRAHRARLGRVAHRLHAHLPAAAARPARRPRPRTARAAPTRRHRRPGATGDRGDMLVAAVVDKDGARAQAGAVPLGNVGSRMRERRPPARRF